MKNLINDLIDKSGLSNKDFAEAVGTTPSYLSQQKKQKNINLEKLTEWMKGFDITEIENTNVKIMLKSK